MNEYIYLYRGNEALRGDRSPQEVQKGMEKWMGWMKDLAAKGHMKDTGFPLENSGKVTRKKGLITDGPYAESKDVISGFTIVLAKDLAQAAELASGCPIFETGGFVEVRPIMKMGM
jgi:hypothetical protein